MLPRILCAIISLQIILLPGERKNEIGSLTTYSTQVVPLIIAGEGWSQKLVISNVDESDSAVGTIRFFRADGRPWTLPLKDKGAETVQLINLQPGQTLVLETEAKETSQELGWAYVDLSSGGLGDIFGQSIFRKQTSGRPDLMTSTPFALYAYDRLHIFFDNLGSKYAGVGIVLVDTCQFGCQDETVKIRFRKLDGSVIAEKTKTYKEGTLNWFSLSAEFPEVIEQIGTMEVEPSAPFASRFAGFSLQFAPNGAFTSVASFEN